jgi:hypothetical protein
VHVSCGVGTECLYIEDSITFVSEIVKGHLYGYVGNVFPVRYKLNVYILKLLLSSLKVLRSIGMVMWVYIDLVHGAL